LNGQRVIAKLDNGASFKQLVVEGERRYLKALNPSWPEQKFDHEDEPCRCVTKCDEVPSWLRA
jgi:SOS-response transcriptional repressor LexA